ncbi:hypothetical protein [Tritonibacter mobilis]|uniref:hypothetical protein n=1 Tax=Tritonibacter mobilis TaxID=379347 RepID=UPI000806D749|nr:hypothetical protein [Tritonibacter mobilis]
MHSEYAVEPAAIGADWETFRYLIEKFGFDKGRLISRMPRRWERKVIAAAKEAGISDVRMTSLVDRLRNSSKNRVADFGRGYDPENSWIANALEQHAERPFRAIITTTTEQTCAEVIAPDLCDEDNDLISAPISCDVPRTVDAISTALLPLAATATDIDIVDPYFELRPLGQDFVGPLAALLSKLAANGCAGKTIRIHWHTHVSRPTPQDLAIVAPGLTKGIIPQGFVLQLFEWDEIAGGEDFHDRYVLGDCGGIMVGAGLSAVGPQENATFSLLADRHAATLRQRFTAGSSVYRLVGQAIELRDDGSATLI